MRYRNLGSTGVKVSALCLGAMNFARDNSDDGVSIIRRALDEGVEEGLAADRVVDGGALRGSGVGHRRPPYRRLSG